MKRCIALLLIFAMMSTVFVGCAPVEPVERDITELNPENPLELIVILGNHANAWLSLEDLKKEDLAAKIRKVSNILFVFSVFSNFMQRMLYTIVEYFMA